MFTWKVPGLTTIHHLKSTNGREVRKTWQSSCLSVFHRCIVGSYVWPDCLVKNGAALRIHIITFSTKMATVRVVHCIRIIQATSEQVTRLDSCPDISTLPVPSVIWVLSFAIALFFSGAYAWSHIPRVVRPPNNRSSLDDLDVSECPCVICRSRRQEASCNLDPKGCHEPCPYPIML